jgi:hypothetical protein
MFNFQPAVKEQSTLLCAMYGPSGSGKTYTSLRIATGMTQALGQDRFAVLDTEYGRASLYADRFNFDTLKLDNPKTLERYQQAMDAAIEAGYKVLVIDSLTHAWNELLAEVDRLANTKFRGNSWRAWSEGTPIQRKFIDDYLLASPLHLICTMRSKTEWEVSKNSDGRTSVERLGTSPMQGKGIEYEFTLLMSLSPDHVAIVEKDNTGKYQDKTIAKPSEELGKHLIEWLQSGKPPVVSPKFEPQTKAAPEPKQPTYGRPAGVTDDKLWIRYASLVEQAMDLDLQVDPLPSDTTNEELIEKGVALKEVIELAKETE